MFDLRTAEDVKNLTNEEAKEADRYLCRNSLKYLCVYKLGFQDWDTCHDQLEQFIKRSTKNKILILFPREHLKSSIVTIGYTIQQLLNDPNISVLIENEILGNATKFLDSIKMHLKVPEMTYLFGEFQGDLWNQDEIKIRQRTSASATPTIMAAGVEKTTVSQHYDLIILDDILSRKTIGTAEQIEKTRNVYSDSLDLLKKPAGKLIIIGTRWDDKDLYGDILRNERDMFDVFQMGATENGEIDGQVVFPKKFSTQILKDLLRSKGTYDTYCQYFNNPVPKASQHFKPPVRYWESIPEKAVHFITLDPAPSDPADDGEQRDFNVITDCVWTAANQMQVVEYRRGHWDPGQTIAHLFEMVETYKPLVVGVESVLYQKVLIYLLDVEMKKRGKFFRIVPISPHTDKFQRIMGLQPLWEQGNILLKQGMVELEDEFERFPRGMHDDILDTLAMQLHLISGHMPEIQQVFAYDHLKTVDLGSYREWEGYAKRIAERTQSQQRMEEVMRVGE